MCGIAGETVWGNMQRSSQYRGSDKSGIYTDANATLIHTRLNVVDLENGTQPMTFAKGDKEYTIVYNGELYNTIELRDELKSLGHIFTSHSDTEVLLHSYMQWKENCVHRLNGIFAFAVWENHSHRLFIARDRIGVKPFFYVHQGEEFIFASEIKTLLTSKKIRAEIDSNSIAEIILLGPGRTPGFGVFRGVCELPPAFCGFFSNGSLEIKQYWKPLDKVFTDSFEQAVENVRFLITDSVRRQLVSDVPVGAFLSGGLDSSIISAIAAKERPLQTFSVYYKDNERFFEKSHFQPDSDDSYIDAMTKHLGIEHHRIEINTDDLVDALEAAVDARALPGMADIDASLLLFCKEVKNHVTVALSGEGADEIFGGYPWYRDREILMRDGFPWATNPRTGFLKKEQKSYVQKRYKKTLASAHILPNQTPHEHRMKEMFNLNLHWFMQTLLDRTDRMSMYNGLEVRVPFCDHRIVEYLYTVPWEMKDYNSREKGLLREAMRGLLPDEVLWRKKSPYPKTHNPAYLTAVSKKLCDIIQDSGSPLLQIVRKDALLKLLKSTNPTPWYGQLMTTPQTIAYFLQIDYWLREYDVRVV
ncbi:MAG: asparagine synthase (glutamine-hydrolyzing) [Defluviitaleaceae bacterium]|nr:asparagine synthase (glutamine-hydrolyzing) [Defluviitaleaceae bacterium]